MNRETSDPNPYTAEWRASSPSRRPSNTLLLAPRSAGNALGLRNLGAALS